MSCPICSPVPSNLAFCLIYSLSLSPPGYHSRDSYNMDVDKGPVFVKWFEGAEINLCYNALDRHVEAGMGDRVAFHW